MYTQAHRAQTSIEFITIVAIIIIITFFFVASLFGTFDINFAIHKTKNKTLELISLADEPIIIQKVDYEVNNNTLQLTLNLQKINTTQEPFTLEDYNVVLDELIKKTKFEDVDITFNYTN